MSGTRGIAGSGAGSGAEARFAGRGSVRARLRLLGDWVLLMWQTARERKQLRQMDERMLRDIGVGPEARYGEGGRPFWDLPERHRERLRRMRDLC